MPEESRPGILDRLSTDTTKVIALVTLVVEATYLASIAALSPEHVLWALIVSATVFVVVLIGVIVLRVHELKNPEPAAQDLTPSPLTPDSPILDSIIRGAMQTVCRGVTVPRTPEEAEMRAFIFKKQGDALVCTHFWAPESLRVREEVGLTFELKPELAQTVAVVKAYFDRKPTRTAIAPLPHGSEGVTGEVEEGLTFVLAAPIYNKDADNTIWGVVDFDTKNEVGRALLSTSISDNVMYHLAEHLRLIVSLTEPDAEIAAGAPARRDHAARPGG